MNNTNNRLITQLRATIAHIKAVPRYGNLLGDADYIEEAAKVLSIATAQQNKVHIYLSRRNLLTLLAKLDVVKEGNPSSCTIIKKDTEHPKYPQSHPHIFVTGVENEEYYFDREFGLMREDI